MNCNCGNGFGNNGWLIILLIILIGCGGVGCGGGNSCCGNNCCCGNGCGCNDCDRGCGC